jgi:hypothetical protein
MCDSVTCGLHARRSDVLGKLLCCIKCDQHLMHLFFAADATRLLHATSYAMLRCVHAGCCHLLLTLHMNACWASYRTTLTQICMYHNLCCSCSCCCYFPATAAAAVHAGCYHLLLMPRMTGCWASCWISMRRRTRWHSSWRASPSCRWG